MNIEYAKFKFLTSNSKIPLLILDTHDPHIYFQILGLSFELQLEKMRKQQQRNQNQMKTKKKMEKNSICEIE